MTTTTAKPANAATIAKFFGLAGKAAVEAIKGLTPEEKEALGEGIRDGSLTY